ncbi:dienelactone hydrolase family protein [Legionella worsleiensis]|uniref:Dienelactone hydrolase family protein n=1 Tax=Legionella worsleiensis TaxID=45076 RepID=A0A0W1AKD6_9GAMM|nr:dienelactone hydrolase family protein [Legionella worsleiensis]KTD81796.1 Dienelactone hydrolase family protein [Legionella worsleiensis]STY31102.1 Predicted dienelactone hydrolase [Legionella worsleiensis]
MKKNILILFIVMMFSLSLVHAKDEYQFDPKDVHHSLLIPDEQRRSPAILLLHASTGIEPVNYDWATRLKNHGYVVYIIDSFKPRGWEDRKSVGWDRATEAQLSDVAPAYEYLSHLPFVDPDRIGILGFSMGGFDVLKVMETSMSDPKPYQTLPFKAAASFYGVCHRLDPETKLRGPTQVFIGSEDDRAPTKNCIDLVYRSAQNNELVSLILYPDALHGFDNFEFPPSKEVTDERGEFYHIGFNEEARQKALEDLPRFFDMFLQNQ